MQEEALTLQVESRFLRKIQTIYHLVLLKPSEIIVFNKSNLTKTFETHHLPNTMDKLWLEMALVLYSEIVD